MRPRNVILSPTARRRPGYVNVIVLCELAWVLTTAYDASQEKLARVIDQLLRTRQLQIQRRDQVRSALAEYRDSKAGFPDCLIGQLNWADGAGETVTFDQNAAQMDQWCELEW